ncbi:MAG: hypothetical protein KA149_01420 [Chitinophagales bacterium]|nr:hypothetical protein [Chitinophagales bacterium]
MLRLPVVLLFCLVVSVGYCQTVEVKQPKELQQFKKEQEPRIKQNQAHIEDLKNKKPDNKHKFDAQTDKQVAALEIALRDLKVRLDTYRYTDKESWETFKRNYNHDMDELEKILEDLFRDDS